MYKKIKGENFTNKDLNYIFCDFDKIQDRKKGLVFKYTNIKINGFN